MCIRDRRGIRVLTVYGGRAYEPQVEALKRGVEVVVGTPGPVSYTHLRAHETVLDLVCRLLLEKKKQLQVTDIYTSTKINTVI